MKKNQSAPPRFQGNRDWQPPKGLRVYQRRDGEFVASRPPKVNVRLGPGWQRCSSKVGERHGTYQG